MACKIADNHALAKLRTDLGLKPTCHSLREHCLMSLERKVSQNTMGIPGTAIGYCQALFTREGNSFEHTKSVLNYLEEIGMPWSKSHEMYYGYRESQALNDFIHCGVQPLISGGRMPILITALNPTKDEREIIQIISTNNSIYPGETALVRLVLSSDDDIESISKLMLEMLRMAEAEGVMPKWWPLLQGKLTVEQWKTLKRQLGQSWQYTNIAINPFVNQATIDIVWDQITVAQVAVGEASEIKDTGEIALSQNMPMARGLERIDYNLFDYMNNLSSLTVAPTLIVLGPSLSGWSVDMNKQRLQQLKPLLAEATKKLWRGLDDKAYMEVWDQAA